MGGYIPKDVVFMGVFHNLVLKCIYICEYIFPFVLETQCTSVEIIILEAQCMHPSTTCIATFLLFLVKISVHQNICLFLSTYRSQIDVYKFVRQFRFYLFVNQNVFPNIVVLSIKLIRKRKIAKNTFFKVPVFMFTLYTNHFYIHF